MQSWGRLDSPAHEVVALDRLAELNALPLANGTEVSEAAATGEVAAGKGLAFGMGRSYGDACLNPGGTLWLTAGRDLWLALDTETGVLSCQSGVLLGDIQRLLAPRGWMLPVTPGTQYVTVGGAIANDVHGKNHHRAGTFGEHVLSLTLLRTDGESITCGPHLRADWFRATVGGLGLTGFITQAKLQLQRVAGPWLTTHSTAFESLEAFYPMAEQAEAEWEYTVAWIDCLHRSGRGIFMRANHTQHEQAGLPQSHQRSVPFTPPVSLVNGLSLRAFNSAYYHLHKRRRETAVAHYRPFFYPLDGVGHWNRMYGPKGFYQYQCVVPAEDGARAIRALLAAISASGQGSFLAVLKTFGERPAAGLLSFVRPGITLALDFPNRGSQTLALFHRLDAIVASAGGRLYPAKDARMPAELFRAGYPAIADFSPFCDPGISSAMSRRLLGR